MRRRNPFKINKISQRRFYTSSHSRRSSRMNISKHRRYSSSPSPERRKSTRHSLPGNKYSSYSRYSSQRSDVQRKRLPSARGGRSSNIRNSCSSTWEYENGRSSINRDSRERDRSRDSRECDRSSIIRDSRERDRSSIIRDSRERDIGRSSIIRDSKSPRGYDSVIEALSRAVSSLTEEVRSIKAASQSKPDQSRHNRTESPPEPEAGYYRRARNVLEDMDEEQYKNFHDEVVQILSGLDDTLQLDHTKKWTDIARHVAKNTMKEIDKAMKGRFQYKDTELKWVLQQLH
ncbi:hypothetical protein RhiirA4_487577, partial [Rhizophagus irregularis]